MININKGLDLPISGQPEQTIGVSPEADHRCKSRGEARRPLGSMRLPRLASVYVCGGWRHR